MSNFVLFSGVYWIILNEYLDIRLHAVTLTGDLYTMIKVYTYSPDILESSLNCTSIAPKYWNLFFHSLISRERIHIIFCRSSHHTVQIFVPPGTHYYWVVVGGVNCKLSQGFITSQAVRESNPRLLDLGSNALSTRPRAPLNNRI